MTTGISNTVTPSTWQTEKADTRQSIQAKEQKIKQSISAYEDQLGDQKKAMLEKLNRLISLLMLSRRVNIEMKEILHEKTMANLEKK